jgi:hypothetical protein
MRRTSSRRAFSWALASLLLLLPACTKKLVVAPELEARCLVSRDTLSFGHTRVGDRAGARSFTITNDGEGVLTGTVTDSCGPFVVTSGSGAFRLGPGLSRTIVVEFHPTATGAAGCELSFGGNVRCGAVACSGTGTPRGAVCVLDPAQLAFGDQAVGTCSATRPFTLGNVGGDTLTGSVPSSCGPFTVPVGSGPFRLAPGRSLDVQVRFCPTAAGPAACDLSLGGDVACAALACSGTGIVLPSSCQVSPATLDFGDQALGTCSATRSFTITNDGQATLAGSVPSCPPFEITSGGGGFSLLPGESWTVGVRFCPTTLDASRCDLAIDGVTSCPPVSCTGAGTAAPACQVSPSSLAFGNLNVGACTDTQSFTIANTGGGLLAGTVPAACGPYAVTAGAGAYSLPAGGSRRVSVKFCPVAQGFAECDLPLASNAACQAVPFYGVGLCTNSVNVTSVPAGALIYVDGATSGYITPHTFSLSQGLHTIRVQRNGVTYFAPRDTTLSIPCVGSVNVPFAGHHVENYYADASTWIDQAAPAQNNCTSPDLFVGQDSVGGHTTGALIHLYTAPSSLWAVYRATLQVHETDCGSTTTAIEVKAYPVDQEWSACAPTWAAPGVTWTNASASPALRLACPTAWRLFDVAAVVAQWAGGNGVPHGWILLPSAPPARGISVRRFDSARAASSSNYPYLTIDYVER